jgi:ABC-type transport system substrate-binding protein
VGISASSATARADMPTKRRRWRRPRRGSRSLVLATTLAMVLAIAACGGGDDGGGSGGEGASADTGEDSGGCGSAPAAEAGGDDDEATADDADRSAILRWGAMRTESMDPIRAVGVDYATLHAVFDTLVSISPDDGSLLPRLATEWEADAESVVLTLRDDVTFQDGTPFDAEAVAFNIDRAMNDPESNITEMLTAIEGVDVVDPLTVEIRLAEPTPLAVLQLLADRPGMMASPDAVRAAGDSTAFSDAPVGAGMYAIEGEWFPRESLSVRAWDGYWDPDAQTLGGIDFTEVEPDAKVNALLSGSVDVASVGGADVSALEDDGDVAVTIGSATIGRGLTVNPTLEPFDDIQVRQAVAHAINRDAVVEALTDGYGEARCQLFSANSPAYDEELDGLYPYDPDRARELLEEAGYDDGLEFRAIIGSGATAYVQFGELLQAQLAEVGIEMDLELVDRARTLPMLYEEDAAPAAPIGGGADAALTDVFIRNYLLEDGSFNAGDVELPEVRGLLEEAGAQADVEAARPMYQELNREVAEDLFQIIPVYADAVVTGHQANVRGLHPGHLDVDPSPELLRGVYIVEE